MNLQVVARFLATTAHNHECRPAIKPPVIQKTKNFLRTLKIATACEFFYPVGNILTHFGRVRSSQTTTERKHQTVVWETIRVGERPGAVKCCSVRRWPRAVPSLLTLHMGCMPRHARHLV